MKLSSFARLFVAFAVFSVLSANTSSAAEPEDTAVVKSILAKQETAWNAGDAAAYGEGFDQDGTFTNIRGMVLFGHDAFVARHTEIFKTVFKGSSVKMTARRIHFSAPGVAIVDVDIEMKGYRGLPPGVTVPADGVLRTCLLEVLVNKNGQWSVVAYHNVDVKPN